jgi:hypothetical protein
MAENNNKKTTTKKVDNKKERYFFKSEKELGFKKRTYFSPILNKKVIVLAGEETTKEVFNNLDDKAKKVFLTDKEYSELLAKREELKKEDK